MKKFDFIFSLPPRQLLLRLLARLHCGLVAAILFATAFAMLPMATISVRTSPETAFLRGLLFAIPTALCYYAIKALRSLWKFLLAALLLCAFSWLLVGHWGGAVFMAVMCLFRVRIRMQEEEDGPITSLFDRPTYLALGVFLLAFLVSAVAGLDALQKLSLVGAVLYLLVCLSFHGLSRVDDYLTLNKDMNRLPEKRIQRIAGAALAAVILAGAVLLLPAAFTWEGGVRIHLPEHTPGSSSAPQVEAEREASPMTFDAEALEEELMGGHTWSIPPIVSNILLAIVGVGVAALMCYGVVRFFQEFTRSYSDSRDLIQRLTKEDQDSDNVHRELRKRPAIWDRSPNAAVRRRYRRAILRSGKDEPRSSLTPEELESWAGLREQRLHELYEKARYGQEPCTPAEAKEAAKLG